MSLYHETKYKRKLTKLMGVFQSTRFLQLFEVQYDYVIHICRLIAKIKVTDTHTCKKRAMLRRRLFWPKKIAEKVRKSRQKCVNRENR